MTHWPDWLDEISNYFLSGKDERREYRQIYVRTIIAVVLVGALGFLFLKSCGTLTVGE